MKSSTEFQLPANLPECFISRFEKLDKYARQEKLATQLLWPKNTPDGKPEIMTVIFSAS